MEGESGSLVFLLGCLFQYETENEITNLDEEMQAVEVWNGQDRA